MKYLITGGAGFIGSNLIDYLIDNDKIAESDIRVLVPPWESLKNLYGRGVEIFVGDIRDKRIFEKLTKDVDVIYHLAAKTVIPGGTYQYYKDTNVDGTRYLLEAAGRAKVRKFIYYSSISVFGLPAIKGDMEDYNEKFPKEPSEPYGATKLEGEKLVKQAYKKWRLPHIIIRPSTVYGPRDKAGIYQLMTVINKGLNFFIGSAENKMDYVYVYDLVKATRQAEKSSVRNEDFIIGSDKTSTQKEIISSIASSLNRRTYPIRIPREFALLASRFVEIILNALRIKTIFFPDRIKVLTANCYFDVSKAKKKLNYRPEFTFERGAKITCDWFRDQRISDRVF